MKNRRSINILSLFGFVTVYLLLMGTIRNSSAEIYGQFVGWKACNECHEDISDGWVQTKHAKAFESLAESKQQHLPDCQRCHVVGYDQPGGFLDQELTMELSDVQCESCHGPGQKHIDLAGEPGTIIGTPCKENCRECHTVGQDPNFNFEDKKMYVHEARAIPQPQTPIELSAQPHVPDRGLRVDKSLIDLVRVDEGTSAIAYVTLKNEGEGMVEITDVISA